MTKALVPPTPDIDVHVHLSDANKGYLLTYLADLRLNNIRSCESSAAVWLCPRFIALAHIAT